MKTRARDVDVSLDDSAHDPFAELAEIFESEIGRESIRRHAENARRSDAQTGRDASAVDAMDREFDAAFRDVLTDGQGRRSAPRVAAAGAGENAYRSWVVPRGANPASGSPLKSFALDEALEDAIRSLSAPANPRGTIVVETRSFAPDRVIEETAAEAAEPELDEFDELIASELAALNDHSGYRRRMQLGEVPSHDVEDEDESGAVSLGQSAPLRGERYGAPPSHRDDEELESLEAAGPRRRRPVLSAGFGMLAGASLVTLVVIGAAGYFALHGTAGLPLAGDSEPLLIKADAEPYKVAPKDPGGRSIPNQNKAVYERVANPGTKDPAPQQHTLLADSEEPMELPVEQPFPDLPGVELGEADGIDVKGEDRIETTSATASTAPAVGSAPVKPVAAETAVLEPRKVRTMIVLPDGTLVANPADSTQQAAGSSALIEASSRVAVPQAPVAEVPAASAIASLPTPAAADPIASTLAAVSPVEPEAIGVPVMVAEPAQVAAVEPAGAPLAPPAAAVTQPDVTEEPAVAAPKTAVAPTARPAHSASTAAAPAAEKPQRAAAPIPEPATEVASLQPNGDPFAPPPAGGSGYFVQISSQPSQALAQQSMQKLGARFANVINGRGMGIKAADIPGKGTFYRVRVSAGSKDDALDLCNRLRTVGGNCFVAR